MNILCHCVVSLELRGLHPLQHHILSQRQALSLVIELSEFAECGTCCFCCIWNQRLIIHLSHKHRHTQKASIYDIWHSFVEQWSAYKFWFSLSVAASTFWQNIPTCDDSALFFLGPEVLVSLGLTLLE